MLVHIARRLLLVVPVLFAASVLAFGLSVLGSPAGGSGAAGTGTGPVTSPGTAPDTASGVPLTDGERARLYLDRPVAQRYWLWLTGIGGRGDIGLLRGRWGPSTAPGRDIGGEFAERVGITLKLMLVAVFQGFGLAILSGVLGALARSRLLDRAFTLLGLLALSTPVFWLAELLGETAGGPGSVLLPALVLTLPGYAVTLRYQRTALRAVLDSRHVRLARAKGVRYWTVVWRHALPAALIPVAKSARWVLTGAFSGVVLVEAVFGWRGLGGFLVESVKGGDAYAVAGWLVLAATAVAVTSLVVDLWYVTLDPLVRYE